MGGDKIVLLDGAGANGGGAATNGLLSMIPGMFANLIGGNKMDPNLVAALMNGRNNQDGFGGANGWWLWIIVLFWLWGGRGFGNGFEKCGAKKPDKATWGDVQYVFAMYYSDGFPKVFKCENELVKATLMYLDDPDAPEGVAFIRWLAVQDYLGEKINWKDLT